jgi:hypothetical protein
MGFFIASWVPNGLALLNDVVKERYAPEHNKKITKTAPATPDKVFQFVPVLPQKRAGKPVPSMLAEHIASSNPSLARETTLSSGKTQKGDQSPLLSQEQSLGG